VENRSADEALCTISAILILAGVQLQFRTGESITGATLQEAAGIRSIREPKLP
jgi:hypothetical protein